MLIDIMVMSYLTVYVLFFEVKQKPYIFYRWEKPVTLFPRGFTNFEVRIVIYNRGQNSISESLYIIGDKCLFRNRYIL